MTSKKGIFRGISNLSRASSSVSTESNASRSDKNSVSKNGIVISASTKPPQKLRINDDSSPSPRRKALLERARKYSDGQSSIDAGDYDMAKQHFNEALKARLMLFGANSDLVSRCHFKLLEIAFLEGNEERVHYHERAIERGCDT